MFVPTRSTSRSTGACGASPAPASRCAGCAATPASASTPRCGSRSARRARCVDGGRRGRWARATGTVGGAYLLSTSIKLAVGRKRPKVEDLPHLMATPTGLSFPSSHATSSFAAARAFGVLLPAGPLYGAAVAMGASRLYLGVHYPSDVAAGAALGSRRGEPRPMKVGIVGMPNAGKSSLFNALTRAGAEAANYPFTTIEPNVAVVPVRDPRLEAVAETIKASNLVPDTIDFHDIAGLVAGAHKGEGLGNQFLANIRETDALLHVVRCHQDENVIHPEGRVDPAADMETIETELVFADLEQAERRHARVVREARGGDKAAIAEQAWLEQVMDALQRGEPARGVPVPEAAPNALRNLSPLTGKPVLFVANVDEGDDSVPAVVADHAAAAGAAAVAISSRIEAELSELEDDEAAVMRDELGVAESGLDRVVRGAFGLLDLLAFFTAGEDKPAQSWHLRRGLTAWHAAGSIHSDIQKGFVRAEVIGWEALVEAGGYAGARDKGTLRLEGRDYVMADGDVITVKFTP